MQAVQSGAWTGLVKLESVKQLNMLLPYEFVNLRNLFQYILTEIFYSMSKIKYSLLEDPETPQESKNLVTIQKLPFEVLTLKMRHCKESLADRHLLGKIRTKINTDGIVASHHLDSLPRNSQGWRKI